MYIFFILNFKFKFCCHTISNLNLKFIYILWEIFHNLKSDKDLISNQLILKFSLKFILKNTGGIYYLILSTVWCLKKSTIRWKVWFSKTLNEKKKKVSNVNLM